MATAKKKGRPPKVSESNQDSAEETFPRIIEVSEEEFSDIVGKYNLSIVGTLYRDGNKMLVLKLDSKDSKT